MNQPVPIAPPAIDTSNIIPNSIILSQDPVKSSKLREAARALLGVGGIRKYYSVILLVTIIIINFIILFVRLPEIYHPLLSGSLVVALILVWFVHRWRMTPEIGINYIGKHVSILALVTYFCYTAYWISTFVPKRNCLT